MKIALVIENIKRENEKYFTIFQTYLESYGYSEKLIKHHIYYTEYYLNQYLAQELQKGMIEGIEELHVFFMEYFYGNYNDYGVFASEEMMERILEGLKNFYHCMYENGYVNEELYSCFVDTVKENKQQWMDELRWNKNFDDTISASGLDESDE